MIPNYFPSDPRDYLREELHLRQQRRPQYSLRAFARDLSMSPSSLCEFLSGRQGLSQERVRAIGSRLGLGLEQQEHLWDLVESRFGRSEPDRKAALTRSQRRSQDSGQRLSVERFRLMASWYPMAILEILSLPGRQYSTLQLAHILSVSTEEVELALKRMADFGLIGFDETGRAHVASEITLVGDEGADEAIKQAHHQALLMHAEAALKKPMQERESLNMHFRVNQGDWQDLRREMKQALWEVAARYAANAQNPNQVISMSMQMVTLLPLEEKTNDAT